MTEKYFFTLLLLFVLSGSVYGQKSKQDCVTGYNIRKNQGAAASDYLRDIDGNNVCTEGPFNNRYVYTIHRASDGGATPYVIDDKCELVPLGETRVPSYIFFKNVNTDDPTDSVYVFFTSNGRTCSLKFASTPEYRLTEGRNIDTGYQHNIGYAHYFDQNLWDRQFLIQNTYSTSKGSGDFYFDGVIRIHGLYKYF